MKKLLKPILTLLLLLTLCSCKARSTAGKTPDTNLSVLVYITGFIAGSPSYEMLAEGAKEFENEHSSIKLTIYEAGVNQAEWEEQLTSLIAQNSFDLVLGSNPSLPEICASVGKKFPSQKFAITDAFYDKQNPQIITWMFNQYEQALFIGYLAGLITTSNLPFANSAKRIGFIAAQEFPLLTRNIVPGFIDGAHKADTAIQLDFRVVGNWFDSSKAADLTTSMINAGVDVFTSIAGGAAQGMIRTIAEKGAYSVSFNTNEYNKAPGYILGCGQMEQKKLVKEILSDFISGKLEFGTAQIVGVKEGYINFIDDDPAYTDSVPLEIQKKFNLFMSNLRAGNIEYTVPPL